MTDIRLTFSLFALLLAFGFTNADAQDHRRAFVTSTTGSGDLSSWGDAGAQTGLAAGDAICQARAAEGGLANPQNFVAWLSDENNDAYCRVHGLSGKKADNCGQPELPEAAGPWVRTDGLPFAEGLPGLLDPLSRVITPLRFDEFGNQVSNPSVIATSTNGVGELNPFTSSGTCENWTNGTASAGFSSGTTLATHRLWTFSGGSNCAVQSRLACLETGTGPNLPQMQADGNLAFLSSSRGSGDLSTWLLAAPGTSGIEAGDSICRALAGSRGFDNPHRFKAWLSDDEVEAVERFEFDGPWYRVDGALVARNKAELASGNLVTPLNQTDFGFYASSNFGTWTGTLAGGDAGSDNCGNWTSTDGTGVSGAQVWVDGQWTQRSGQSSIICTLPYHIYCLEDNERPIFTDRFEAPPPVTQTIGPDGGELATASGAFRIELPPGAVDENTEFQLISLGSTPKAPYGRFRMEPSPFNFELPVLLEYQGSSLPESVLMARFADGEILPLRTSVKDGDTVRAATRTFSEFGLINADADCGCDEGEVCFEGVCIQPCATDECDEDDYQCLWEECPGSTCDDVACPEGTVCECGVCEEEDPGPQACTSNSDCTGNDVCRFNSCDGFNQCVDPAVFAGAPATSYDPAQGRMHGKWIGYSSGGSCFGGFNNPFVELELAHAPDASTVTGTASQIAPPGNPTVDLNRSTWDEARQRFTTSWDLRIDGRNENFQLTDCQPLTIINPLHVLRCDYSTSLIGAAIRVELRRQ